jgi:hypothetical protein
MMDLIDELMARGLYQSQGITIPLARHIVRSSAPMRESETLGSYWDRIRVSAVEWDAGITSKATPKKNPKQP